MSTYIPDYPQRGPTNVRCRVCLEPMTRIRYHDRSYAGRYSDCPAVSHLHWHSNCGWSMVTKTAEDSGRDASRQ